MQEKENFILWKKQRCGSFEVSKRNYVICVSVLEITNNRKTFYKPKRVFSWLVGVFSIIFVSSCWLFLALYPLASDLRCFSAAFSFRVCSRLLLVFHAVVVLWVQSLVQSLVLNWKMSLAIFVCNYSYNLCYKASFYYKWIRASKESKSPSDVSACCSGV